MAKVSAQRLDWVVREIARKIPGADETTIRRSVDRMALPPLPDMQPPPTLAQVRQAAEALAPFRDWMAHWPAFREVEASFAYWANHAVQEPPPHANTQKYRCASESFQLHQDFGVLATGYQDGGYHIVAALLYEAATGTSGADMRRACNLVLDARCKFPQ
jgi:hypothetical protein